jgi:hypothetical protein
MEKDGEDQSEQSGEKFKRILRRVKEDRNITLTIKRRTVNWIGYALRGTAFQNTVLKER